MLEFKPEKNKITNFSDAIKNWFVDQIRKNWHYRVISWRQLELIRLLHFDSIPTSCNALDLNDVLTLWSLKSFKWIGTNIFLGMLYPPLDDSLTDVPTHFDSSSNYWERTGDLLNLKAKKWNRRAGTTN